jgi:dihydrofolate reductase
VDAQGDMRWAHRDDSDAAWNRFVSGNAQGGGVLLFGRVTYDLMASYWPTPLAAKASPIVAERMNALPKVVFSRTMGKAAWNNTKVVKGRLAAAVRKMKREPGADMVILGSGTIVSQLTDARLIDEYQIVVVPIVLGSGRTLFEGVKKPVHLTLKKSRAFRNGNVVLCYEPAE